MFSCRRARGLIAAALYESLGQSDQEFLERHVTNCGACRAEQSSLARLVTALPADLPESSIDLLPALRRAIATPERPQVNYGVRFAFAAGFCAVVAGSAWLYTMERPQKQVEIAQVVTDATDSPVATALTEAQALLTERRPKEAFLSLKKAAETYPDASETPRAMVEMARLSFDELHWYKESHTIHKALTTKYLSYTKTSPEADKLQERLNELDEASRANYEPLFRLDEAKADRSGAFAKLETLVAEHPAGYIAHDAVLSMAKIVASESATPLTTAALLDEARGRCTKPVAKTQVTWELARVYDGADMAKAKALYAEVVKGPDTSLARMAKAALSEANTPPIPK